MQTLLPTVSLVVGSLLGLDNQNMAISATVDDIENVVQWINTYYREDVGRFVQHYPKERRVFEVSYEDLRRGLPQLADQYKSDPDGVEEILKDALARYDIPVPVNWSRATVQVTGLDKALEYDVVDVGSYHPSDLDMNFELLRGQITKRSQSKPKADTIVYECQRCGGLNEMPQLEHNKQEPHDCNQCDRQGPFVINKERTLKNSHDYQLIRLQEPPEKAGNSNGDTIDVVLEKHLVGAVEPGDRAVVGTEIDLIEDDDTPTFELKGRAKSLDKLESDFESIDIEEYREDIEEIASSSDAHDRVVDSIAPSHYGDRELKEALAYSLFGGVPKKQDDGKEVRGTIHVFMVGDPGCGKSAMLQYINDISPRSVYTSGAASTAAGLTCAAMKDDFGDGGWTLEAGALVEANKGVACIDELDDMEEEDRAGMLEAMSEQTISVSKAGINATLPARATVLAAANPAHGRYDTYGNIAEQIDVHPALLSRFDLIFTMQDKPDEERDSNIADRQLSEPEDVSPEIEPDMLRAYVAMARRIDPKLTDAAKERTKQEYVAFRQMNDDDGPIPITPRMVESMRRLTEASARVRLSETATVDDVERALTVYKSWLEDVGVDYETGDFDADIIETGSSAAQRDRVEAILATVKDLQDEYNEGAPKVAVVDHPALEKYGSENIEHTIGTLMEKGELYEPQSGYLRSTE